MITRILTALALIPVVLALVWWAPPWLFFLGVLPFAFLALWEYLELMGRAGAAPARLPVYLAGLALWLVAAHRPDQLLAVIIGSSPLLFGMALLQQGEVTEIPSAVAASIFGLFYTAVPFALIITLRAGEPEGPRVVLYLLLLVWVSDSAAYFGGRGLGRHKLAASLSPGKTVEGTVVSLVVTVGAGYWLFRVWFGEFGWVNALLLPLVVNLAAQLGDLAESGLKRGAGVKASSGLLPGHGGMLDRVDGLLFAVPALWYYWNAVIWDVF